MNDFTSTDKYGTKAVQEYLIPIMVDLDSFCREHNIRYSLFGGGLLGAVRHHGFVPWDDDLDIIFDRENFEKFLSLAKDELPDEYTIVSEIWVKRFTRKDNPRIDYQEGCIDLFVFDNVPDNALFAHFKNFVLKTLQGMMKRNREYKKFNLIQKILVAGTHFIGLFFPYKTKLRMYDRVSQWGNKKPTSKINNYVTYYNMIMKMKYDPIVLDGYTEMDFEGHRFSVFSHYHEALSTQFGKDYMTPVEESKRVPTHLKR